MNQQQIDIVSVCVFIAALLFSPNVAAVVGPYVVIVLASTIGASFALARREKTSRWNAVFFFLRINGLAVLLTVLLATYAGLYFPNLQKHALLVPIALLVGFVGDDWPKVLSKVLKGIFAAIDLARGKGGSSNG